MSGRLANIGGPGFVSFRSRIKDIAETHRSLSILVSMAIVGLLLPILATVPPFSIFQNQDV